MENGRLSSTSEAALSSASQSSVFFAAVMGALGRNDEDQRAK
jgi:hypothetical protein